MPTLAELQKKYAKKEISEPLIDEKKPISDSKKSKTTKILLKKKSFQNRILSGKITQK